MSHQLFHQRLGFVNTAAGEQAVKRAAKSVDGYHCYTYAVPATPHLQAIETLKTELAETKAKILTQDREAERKEKNAAQLAKGDAQRREKYEEAKAAIRTCIEGAPREFEFQAARAWIDGANTCCKPFIFDN